MGIFMKRKRNVLNSTFFTRTWYTDCKQTNPFFGIRVVLPQVDSPQKVSRFAPLNRYYIIIDEVFFDNFLVTIYLLVVCQKKMIIHLFWSTLIIYLLVVYKKK